MSTLCTVQKHYWERNSTCPWLRSWTALTEVTTKSRAFQALSQLLLAWPQPSHASMCLRVWFVPHGHIVVIGNPYLALLILSESCFSNIRSVVCSLHDKEGCRRNNKMKGREEMVLICHKCVLNSIQQIILTRGSSWQRHGCMTEISTKRVFEKLWQMCVAFNVY